MIIMETEKAYEIRQAIEAIKEYRKILTKVILEQTDIADALPYERMYRELSIAIFNLKSQYTIEQRNR